MPQETGGKFKRIVWPLAVAQTLLWAGAFYLFPSLLRTWESELGWTKTELAGAFTLALLLSALLAPWSDGKSIMAEAGCCFPSRP